VEGDVLDALLECAGASGADLLLLGHSGRGRRSLARRLAMKAPCSVWMAPDGSPVTLDRILVPVDLSRSSADTLSVAAALTALAGQDECCALHVYFNDAPVTFDEFEEVIADDHDQAFALFIAPVDLHGVFTKPLFVESAHVGRTILNVAAQRGCDLIVMGTRGRSRSAAVLLGSETEQIMMDTSVPVLAVKHRGAQLRLRQALADQRLQHGRDPRYS
jgi:nucleotide-binding universal stress UspA family protein